MSAFTPGFLLSIQGFPMFPYIMSSQLRYCVFNLCLGSRSRLKQRTLQGRGQRSIATNCKA